ncbi:MAG: hypothetical protein ACFFCQ_16385 [Promethearchaeota archaeon]
MVISISSVTGYDFTILEFWEEGGIISFEIYSDIEMYSNDGLQPLDLEYTMNGTYVFNGTSATENSVFNYTTTTPSFEIPLDAGITSIDPGMYILVGYRLDAGEEVDYNFIVSGGKIDFLVFNESQFDIWNSSESSSALSITVIETSLGASGTISIPNSDIYYFIWANEETTSITIQLQLDLRFPERTTVESFEVNPVTLEDNEGERTNEMGMDTSNWEIGKQIPLELDKRDVYFSIIQDEDYLTYYDHEYSAIPCFILLKDGYESTEYWKPYTLKGNYTIWKSIYSGITLKETLDADLLNDSSHVVGRVYLRYTVKAAENVHLVSKSKSGSNGLIDFSLIPIFIGILVLTRFRKEWN